MRSLLLDLLANCMYKFLHASSRDGRDRKELSFILLRPLAQTLESLRLIERVDFRGHHNLRTLCQPRIISRQLAIDDLVISHRVSTRDRRHVDQMQQQFGPLNVPQEAIAESVSLVRAFDQSGYVGNDKRAEVAEIDYAEMRFKRRKRVIGNFWPRGRNGRDKG